MEIKYVDNAFLLRMFSQKPGISRSYIGEACIKGINQYVAKITDIEKSCVMADRTKMVAMEDQIRELLGDVSRYHKQAEQMDAELGALIGLNEEFQETVRRAEAHLRDRDEELAELRRAIEKLCTGNAADLADLKKFFFSKNSALLDQMRGHAEDFAKAGRKFAVETNLHEAARGVLEREILDLKHELLLAKRILKDPNLSKLANRKFKTTLDQDNPAKFFVAGAQIKELVEDDDEKEERLEIELCPTRKDKGKLLPGTQMLYNSQLPASELTKKNQFKKLTFT